MSAVATAALLCLAPAAIAADSAPTIAAIGNATVKPTPSNPKSSASIKEAVEAAETKALPLAVTDARAHATDLATAAGLKLGAAVSISDTPSTVPYFYQPQNGTFGTGKFCGNVRNFKTIVNKNGTRRRVPAKGTHKVCRIPTVTASVTVTFAVAG